MDGSDVSESAQNVHPDEVHVRGGGPVRGIRVARSFASGMLRDPERGKSLFATAERHMMK
jgi:hypothetical protein